MTRKKRNIFKRIILGFLLTILIVIIVSVSFVFYLYFTADMKQPVITHNYGETAVEYKDNYRQWSDNYLRQSESGLWEMKLKGDDFERGFAFGKLAKDLLYFQEKVFVDQIQEMIPSEKYLKFLRFFLIIFNRNLGEYITEEYRREIYGMSLSCSDEFNVIGTPYERQLNYHGAHDIGHALQDLMLVGCSSFACWNEDSTNSTLIVGRNFDFYMGDDFARNKIVLFVEPEKGYRYMSVTWAGMIGVLSGMNEKGITVTINAAKSSIPTSSATPISLMTREILQYASNIEEAYAIAEKRKTFVSESILIGSAQDNKAVIIEKSPEKTALFTTEGNQIICSNHFQSEAFKTDKRNIENINTTDSYYRYQRLEELLEKNIPIDEYRTADVLRNHHGLGDEPLGLGNEMALNQFIAHHAVIFKPENLQAWVSTSPWQSGKFVMYDLNKIFSDSIDFSQEIYEKAFTIPADTIFMASEYESLKNYRSLEKYIRTQLKKNEYIPADSIIIFELNNPDYFYMYETLGDYYLSINDADQAEANWQKALTKKIPRVSESERIHRKIKNMHEK